MALFPKINLYSNLLAFKIDILKGLYEDPSQFF
jgi:hypothetical protein